MNKSDFQIVADYFCLNKKQDNPVITVEVGNNHMGNIESAKKYIDEAKRCGVDAVKFQTETYHGLWVDKYLDIELNVGQYKGKRREYHEKTLFYKDDWYEIASHAKKRGIVFFSTATDFESVDLIDELGSPVFKISSMDIINWPLLKYISKKRKPIILATAMANMKEIEDTIKFINENGNKKIVLMQCTGMYPTPNKFANIGVIHYFKEKFNLPVGFSDHTIGIDAPMLAVAAGACLFEKHITLDKNMEGPDHFMCAEPAEIIEMIEKIKYARSILGGSKKELLKEEKDLRNLVRRSLVSKEKIKKGQKILEYMFTAKRPAGGIEPNQMYSLIGKEAIKDIEPDEILFWDDFK